MGSRVSGRQPTRKRPSSVPLRVYGDSPLYWSAFVCAGQSMVHFCRRPRSQWDVPLGGSIDWFYWEGLDIAAKQQVTGLVRRPSVGGPRSGGAAKPSDPTSQGEYPALFGYLVDDSYDDGESRERATLIVFAEDDVFKACLSDKTTDATLWASCKTLSGLLGALEARLRDPEADWRKRRAPGAKPARKG